MNDVRVYSNCYGPLGVWAAVEQLRAAGVTRLELALRGHNMGGLVISGDAVITERTDKDTVRRFQDHLAEHRVQVTSCNIGGGDLRTLEGVKLTETRMRCAKTWFGVPLVVSNAGQPKNPEERACVVEHLRTLGNIAANLDLTIALETHEGPTQNAARMADLMNDINHDHVGINFDTGNIAYYNEGFDPCQELQGVVKWVRNVHLKDNRGGFKDWFFPALGAGGAVDFARVREILAEAGYTGSYTIELEGIGGEPEPGLEARQERIAQSVAHLKKCGYAVG